MNLSRDIFREYDIRGVTGKDLTPEVARLVGRAFAAFLAERNIKGTVAVGRDNRPSGEGLHRELVAGLLESGIDIVDVGIVPTPLAYWAQHNLDVVAGVQITGSHNPPEYNGFKLGVGKGSIYGDDIQRVYELAVAGVFPSGKGSTRDEPIIDRYIDDVVARIGKISRPMRIAADAGNGAGALVAPKLFAKLGVDATCMFCESDGTFPNHHADPTVPENLFDIVNELYKGGYDFGVAFDGDADRIGAIQHDGEIIWGDYLLIIYARDVLTRVKGAPIIFDVKCSQALPEAIEKAGGVPVMWKTGHSLIEEKMHELQRTARWRDVRAHVLRGRMVRLRRRSVRRGAPAQDRRRLGPESPRSAVRRAAIRFDPGDPRRVPRRQEVRDRRRRREVLRREAQDG